MKSTRFKLTAYLLTALLAAFLTGACEDCDDGNNFEDVEQTILVDSLSVKN
jgi:hypothetical protein